MQEKRRDDRLDVKWKAEIRTEDGDFPCKIADVSTAGAKVRCDASLAAGEIVEFHVEGIGDFAAEVKWVENGVTGLYLQGGPDILLKKYAEMSGDYPSSKPAEDNQNDPLNPSVRFPPKIRSV